MKRRLYLFTLWMATSLVLLSTLMMHHHHAERVCFIEERCSEDGHVNDAHTSHQENEQEGCRLHQMHHFIINAKVVKEVRKHLLSDDASFVLAMLPDGISLAASCALQTVEWQERSQPLGEGIPPNHSLRGPPIYS